MDFLKSKMVDRILLILLLSVTITVIFTCPIQYGCYCSSADKYVICHSSLTEKNLPTVVKQIPLTSINLTIKSYEGKALGPNAFEYLENLKSLILHGDKFGSLKIIDKDAFAGLTKLTSLSITGVKIATFPAELFSPLTNLEKLSLPSNHLDNIGDSFQKVSSTIRHLDLSINAFKTFPSQLIKKMPNLVYLDIGQNSISQLNLDFSASAKLSELHMSTTDVTALQDDTFTGLGNLRVLEMRQNRKLQILSTNAFAPLKNLERLVLENSQLKMRAGHFKSLSKLKFLSLNNAFEIEIFPPLFFLGLGSLETLSLRSCGLSEIEEYDFRPFVTLTLKSLDLSYNDLPVIQNNTFFGNKKLEILNLSNRKAEDKNPRIFEANAFRGLNSLKRLDISANHLESIQSNFGIVLEKIKTADINGLENNVTCDCRIWPFLDWIQANNASIDMLCNQPEDLENTTIRSLNSSFIECKKKPIFDYKRNVTTNEVDIGKNISYECSAYAYDVFPVLTYNVTAGNPFPSNDTDIIKDHKVSKDGKYRVHLKFQFDNYQKENIGLITCVASNDYGVTQMVIDVAYEDSGGLATWAIVLIVIVVILVVVSAAALGWWLYHRNGSEKSLYTSDVDANGLTRTYV